MIRNKEGLDAILERRDEELREADRKWKEESAKVSEYYGEIAKYFPQLVDVVDTLNYMDKHLIQAPNIFYLLPKCDWKEDSCNELDIFQVCYNATFNMFINPYEKTIKIRRKTDLVDRKFDLQSKLEGDKWWMHMYCKTFIENVIKALPKDIEKFNKEVDNIK